MNTKVIMCAMIGVFILDTATGMVVLYNQDNEAIVRRDVADSNICRIDEAEKDYWESAR